MSERPVAVGIVEPALPDAMAGAGEFTLAAGEVLKPYNVASGDSLWKIAREQDSSIQRIMAANLLTSDKIFAGQVIQIPTMDPAAVANTTQTIPATSEVVPSFQQAPSATAEIPAPRPSATNPVIQGQISPSTLGVRPTPTAVGNPGLAPDPAPSPAFREIPTPAYKGVPAGQ